MKVGIIGAGAVGAACAMALGQRGSAREIVLVDVARSPAKAVALDMRDGSPTPPTADIGEGSHDDLGGANLVLITAGVNDKAGGATDRSDGEGRLKLLDTNASIYRAILPQPVAVVPDAVPMVVTDPLEQVRNAVEHDVGFANITIEGNNVSQYGIGIVCARLTEAILRGKRSVFPAASYQATCGATR